MYDLINDGDILEMELTKWQLQDLEEFNNEEDLEVLEQVDEEHIAEIAEEMEELERGMALVWELCLLRTSKNVCFY